MFRALFRSSLLALAFCLPSAPALAADQPTPPPAPAVFESSWPKEGVALWVPPREGRLVFSAPVRTSSLEITLLDPAGTPVRGKELERLTSEQETETLTFQIPFLSEGPYVVSWSVTDTTGEDLAGKISFTVDPPLVAGGGQNHRHGENAHLYQDSAGEFTLRIIGLLPLFLLAAAWLRSRRRGGSARSDRLAVRAGAVLLLLVGVVQAVADVVAYVKEFHDYPLSAALAAPAVGVLPLYLLIGGYLLLRAPVDKALFGSIAAVLFLHAGLGHLTGGWSALLLYACYAGTMTGLVAFAASTLAALADTVRARRHAFGAAVRALVLPVLLAVISSFGMLIVHARGFELNIAFADDLRFRALAAVTFAASAVLLGWFTNRRSRLLRAVAFPLALLAVAIGSALLWMPPPAAGL